MQKNTTFIGKKAAENYRQNNFSQGAFRQIYFYYSCNIKFRFMIQKIE